MVPARIRSALVLLSATIGLGGCTSLYGVPGYGGVSVGYGNNGYYDPYYDAYGYPYGGYGGYGSRYYGSGYGSPYGWYDNYYYPGAGYYVYDRSGSRHRWNDAQRRYWEGRRTDGTNPAMEEWRRRQEGVTPATSGGMSSMDSGRVRVQRQSSVAREARSEARSERIEMRQERREERQSRREARQAREPRGNEQPE